MTTAEERELLDEELLREVAEALAATGVNRAQAPAILEQLRQRRLVIYRRVPRQRGEVLRYEHEGEEVVLEQMTLLPETKEADAPAG